jgi:hypothetical protein
MLLLLIPNFSIGQSENDSTFNGIDYYAGRIAKGFGGAVEQKISDKEQGISFSSTLPSVYASISNRLSLQLSNLTSWTRIDDERSYYDKTTSQTVGLQAVYRPTSGVLLSGSGSFGKRKVQGSTIANYRNEEGGYRFRGLYLSEGGRIQLTPYQLAFTYYALPHSSFLQNDRSFRILSPSQSMLDVWGSEQNLEFSVGYGSMSSGFSSSDYSTSMSHRNISIEFIHAFSRRVTFGVDLRTSRDTGRNDNSGPAYDYHQLNKITSPSFASRIEIFGSKQILHRLGGLFYSSDLDQTITRDANGTKEIRTQAYKTWRVDYSIHYLKNPTPTSMEAFLADQHQIFGNRLPARGFHWIGRASTDFSRGNADILTPTVPNTSTWEAESRYYDLSTVAIYGLSNWLEVGWKASYRRGIGKSTDPSTIPTTSTDKSSEWSNSLVLSFANYRYENRFKDRFGWEQIREFDRLYDPLLLGGMIKGTLAIQYDSYKSEWQDGSFSGHRNWYAETQMRLGISNNLELNLLGYIKKERILDSDRTTYKQVNASLAWQPWQTIRFYIGRDDSAVDYEFGGESDSGMWTFKIVTLF